MKSIKKIFLIGFLTVLVYAVSWIACVGFCWMIFFVIGKLGFPVHLSVWWSGLLLCLVCLLFSRPKK